jgi:hypothetical protein
LAQPRLSLLKKDKKYRNDLLSVHISGRINVNGQYIISGKHFDFDSDMEPWTVARAMARYNLNFSQK